MSEVLSIEPVVIAEDIPAAFLDNDESTAKPAEDLSQVSVEDQSSKVPGYTEAEVQAFAQELDQVLTPFLAEHGATVIICERLGGAKMTLSEAVNAIWPFSDTGAMIKEGAASVRGQLEGMLANRVTETEDLAEEDELEESQPDETEEEPAEAQESERKNDTKTEVQEVRKDTKMVDADQPKIEGGEPEHPQLLANVAEKSFEPGRNDTLTAKAEPAASSSRTPLDTINVARTSMPEALAYTPDKPVVPTPEAISGRTIPEFVPGILVEHSRREIEPEAEATDRPLDFEAPETPWFVEDPETLAAAVITELEPVDLSIPDLESAPRIDEVVEFSDEMIKADEDEINQAIINRRMSVDELTSFVEENILQLDHPEQIGLDADDPYEPLEMPSLEPIEGSLETVGETLALEPDSDFEQTQSTDPEQSAQVDPVIEDLLSLLTERISDSEPEVIANINEIIDASFKIEVQTNDDIIAETEVREELEDLFAELLDEAGINYTPELIESLVHLSNIATHEAIKQLLVGGTIQKTMAQAGAIGRSALHLSVPHLYKLELAA